MNNERRKQLAIAHALLERAAAIIEDARNEEEEAHENLPENMQYNSQRSDDMQDAVNWMDEAFTAAEDAKDTLENNFDLPSVTSRALQMAVVS